MKKVSQVCRYVPPSPCPAYTGPEGDAIILITEDDSAIYVRLLDGLHLGVYTATPYPRPLGLLVETPNDVTFIPFYYSQGEYV